MAFDYSNLAATANRLIARYGTTGTLTAAGTTSGSGYPKTVSAGATATCTVVLDQYDQRDRDGSNVTDRDMRALIAPNAGKVPANGDTLTVAGVTFNVRSVMPIMPGGTAVLYDCKVSAA